MDLRVRYSKVTTQGIIQLLRTFLVWFNTYSVKNQYPCGIQHGLQINNHFLMNHSSTYGDDQVHGFQVLAY